MRRALQFKLPSYEIIIICVNVHLNIESLFLCKGVGIPGFLVWVFLGFLSRVKNRSQSCSDREIKKKKKCLYVLFILIGEKSAKIVPLLLYPRGTVESMQPGTM